MTLPEIEICLLSAREEDRSGGDAPEKGNPGWAHAEAMRFNRLSWWQKIEEKRRTRDG